MHQFHPAPQACLGKSDIIDFHCPDIRCKAASLAAASASELELIEKTYVFVRDGIAHSIDCKGTAVTCRASDVLRVGQGLCYAKAHLLAALLRANGIATGFCYQLLGLADGHDPQRVLHGLNAVCSQTVSAGIAWMPGATSPVWTRSFCPMGQSSWPLPCTPSMASTARWIIPIFLPSQTPA